MAMTLGFVPPVGTVSFAVSWPVLESTVKLETLFEVEFATSASRGAAVGGMEGGAE